MKKGKLISLLTGLVILLLVFSGQVMGQEERKIKMDEYQANYNQRLYDQTVEIMKQAKQHFNEYGFEVISSTPDSKLNDYYPYVCFNEALEDALYGYPQDYALDQCKHSSEYVKKQEA